MLRCFAQVGQIGECHYVSLLCDKNANINGGASTQHTDVDQTNNQQSTGSSIATTAITPKTSPCDEHCTEFVATDVVHFARRRLILSDSEQLTVLERKFIIPNASYDFPKNASNRRYNRDWESKFAWLCYSMEEDGAYCSYCVTFGNSKLNDELMDTPFTDWKNACGDKRGRFNNHARSECHLTSMERAEAFLAVAKQGKPSVLQYLSKTYQNKVTRNTKSMLSIIDVILALGCRGLPLRGDWDEKVKKDLGNFHFFIDWKSKMDNDLNQHLQTAPRNAKYLSPKVQNELISCIETEIRESIVQKLNNSKFLSIMADETTDISTKEQVAICFRYLERTEDGYVVNEDFWDLQTLPWQMQKLFQIHQFRR